MRYATPTRSAHRAAPAGALALLRRLSTSGQHRRRSTWFRPARHLRQFSGISPYLRRLTEIRPHLHLRRLTRIRPHLHLRRLTRIRPHLHLRRLSRFRPPRHLRQLVGFRSHRHLRREPYRAAHLLTRGLAALIVLGILVMVGVLAVAEDRRTSARLASAEIDARIASRAVDPAPLSEAEVFSGGSATFGVTQSNLTADCALAAGGALRTVLQRYGCSQAVRAALTVPYADYRITAGVLNLPDAAGAAAVGDRIRAFVETDDGGFADINGTATGPGTPVLWRTRGHYLLYCVITGADGGLVPADTPQVAQITRDVLDTHLYEDVLIRRAA